MCVESTVHHCVTGNAGKCDVETAAAPPNQSAGIRASRSRRPSFVIRIHALEKEGADKR